MTLNELLVGQTGQIVDVEGNDGISIRLMEMGLTEGEEITLLGFAPLAVWFPYGVYRDSHLRHHDDPHLTRPEHDPESYFVSSKKWRRAGAATRAKAGEPGWRDPPGAGGEPAVAGRHGGAPRVVLGVQGVAAGGMCFAVGA